MERAIYVINLLSLIGIVIGLALSYALRDVKYSVMVLICLVVDVITAAIKNHIYYEEEEDERSLAMAKFTMRSPDGNTQEVSIPQITMIPLPLLHVTEATFNLALSVNLVEKNETLDPEEQRCVDYIKDYYYRNTGRRAIPDIIDYLQNQVRMGYGSRTIAVSSSGSSPRYLTTQEQLKLLYKAQTVADGVIGSNSSFMVSQQDEGEAKATTNLTVDVKMAQAEIPDGIKLLLQSAANSLQVAAPTKDN
jgi:hypothetical protein